MSQIYMQEKHHEVINGNWVSAWVKSFDHPFSLFMLVRYDKGKKKWIDLFDNEVEVDEFHSIPKSEYIKMHTGMDMHRYREIYLRSIKRGTSTTSGSTEQAAAQESGEE
jgi:hypothetical protein